MATVNNPVKEDQFNLSDLSGFTAIENEEINKNGTNKKSLEFDEINTGDEFIHQSNEHFFKMICTEMNKLSEKDQSAFRIQILTKLHEILYNGK